MVRWRRRSAPLSAPLLDLRPSRGLHPHPAGLGHRRRPRQLLRAQAGLRLRGHRLRDDRGDRAARRVVYGHHMFVASHVADARARVHGADADHLGAGRWSSSSTGCTRSGSGAIRLDAPMLFALGVVFVFGARRSHRAVPRRHLDRHLPARHHVRRRPLPLDDGGRRVPRLASRRSTSGSRRCSAETMSRTLGKIHFGDQLHRRSSDLRRHAAARQRGYAAPPLRSVRVRTFLALHPRNVRLTHAAFLLAAAQLLFV